MRENSHKKVNMIVMSIAHTGNMYLRPWTSRRNTFLDTGSPLGKTKPCYSQTNCSTV